MGGTEVDEWSEKVEDLLSKCELDRADRAQLLQEIHHVLETGPAGLCGSIRPPISRSALQDLLAAGAFESAALRLMNGCGYMLSRSGEGLVIATVVTSFSDRDYSFSSSSEDVSLCGALMTCLFEGVIARQRTG